MAEEEKVLKKIVKLNPEAKARLIKMQKDIPGLEHQVDRLSKLMDVSSLREKIQWGKEAVKILMEDFVE